MADYTSAFDFIETCDQAVSAETLVGQFQSLIEQFGMTAFAVGEPGSPRTFKPDRIWMGTWPAGWAQLWAEQNWVSADPVIYQLLMQNTPFHWAELRKRASSKGALIMDAAREFKLFDGIGVAIHSGGGHRAAVTMGGLECALSKREEGALHLASIYFHARIEQLLDKRALASIPPLTQRECDCLSWVAIGKTDWEMSQIFGIGEATVKGHVHSAMHKLNATHRAQAVARAIYAGLITP